MKTLSTIGFGLSLFLGLNSFAQTQNLNQNPNYKVSEEKYVEKTDELNSTQGETIQETYKAFDWTEYKAEKKQDRKDRRYEFKKMRYQNRYLYNSNSYNNGFNNNGYNGYNGYNNNGYNNNNGYYNTPNCNSVNGALNTVLLGSALYYLFN
jgi:hypothetical protein